MGCHFLLQCVKVKSESEVAQSCPTLCNSMDCSLPGSSIDGIFQARVLEWVASAFSNDQSRQHIKKQRHSLPKKVRLVKTMVFLVVIYGCESWTRLSDFTCTFRFHALKKEMATHSSVLAWRIPGMREPGGLPSVGLHRVGQN